MDIRDKVVLITGASEGIGAACASLFRERGARVVLNSRFRDRLQTVAREGDLIVPADLYDAGDRRRLIETAIERRGRIDVLINNAGAGLYGPAWNAPEAETRKLFELNFFAPLHLAQLAARHMRERRSGCIVNVSSIAGKITLPWLTLYSASKYAICSLTDGLRMELAPFGIHAMAVCPGYVLTNFQQNVLSSGRPPHRVAASRRFAITAEQCARAIVRGVEREARTVMTPAGGWVLVAAARLFPRIVDAALRRMGQS
jgi:short-subunit dehydrogenase